jgi:hypothetical protein
MREQTVNITTVRANEQSRFGFFPRHTGIKMERKTRFELATFSLARRCSTTEPLPLKFMLFGGEGETRTLTPCGT